MAIRFVAPILLTIFAPLPLEAGWAPFNCGQAHDAALAAHRSAIEHRGYSEEFPIRNAFPKTQSEILENLRDQLTRFESREDREIALAPQVEEVNVLELWSNGLLEFDVVPVENWSTGRCSARAGDRTMVHSIRAYSKDDQREILRAAVGRDGLLVTWTISPQSDEARRAPRPFPDTSRATERAKALFRVVPGPTQYVYLDARGFQCTELYPCLATRLPGGTIAIESNDGEILTLDPTNRRHEVQRAPGDGRPAAMAVPGRYVMTLGPGTVVELRRADPPAD